MDKEKEEKEEEVAELEQNKYEPIAIGRSCFICDRIFNVKEIDKSAEKSKVGLKNIPVRMDPLPGFVHRRCRGQTTMDLIENPTQRKVMSEPNEIRNNE
jgi:uncharacterized protein YlaI